MTRLKFTSRVPVRSPDHPLTPPQQYNLEDGRSVNMPIAPADYPADDTEAGEVLAGKTRHLVYVHGYHVDLEGARGSGNTMFKRTFWLGFRGQFVGLAWRGDDRTPLEFDANAWHAFEAAPRVREFLERVRGWASGPGNVDVIAHSLGNLAVFEALRLQRLNQGNVDLIRNMISIESAMWEEAFEPENVLTYPDLPQGYQGDPITYSVDQQKQNSWRFWFRQLDNAGNELALRDVLAGGNFFHSFNEFDRALRFMRLNDWLNRAAGPPGLKGYHYRRDRLERAAPQQRWRTLDFLSANSMQRLPVLMRNRNSGWFNLGYGVGDLHLPVGSQENPLVRHLGGVNFNARTDANWPQEDGILGFDSHTAHTTVAFHRMYEWYDEFLGTNGGNQASAIPLGEE